MGCAARDVCGDRDPSNPQLSSLETADCRLVGSLPGVEAGRRALANRKVPQQRRNRIPDREATGWTGLHEEDRAVWIKGQ